MTPGAGTFRRALMMTKGDHVAKALYGHLATTDQRLVAEIARLRTRVKDLERLVEQLELERELPLDPLPNVALEEELATATV